MTNASQPRRDNPTFELLRRKCAEYEARIEKLEKLVDERDVQVKALTRLLDTELHVKTPTLPPFVRG